MVVDETNEAIEGVGNLGGEGEESVDGAEVGEEEAQVGDGGKETPDGPAAEVQVEEDVANVVGAPGLLGVVVDEEDESVEENGGNHVRDVAEGEDTVEEGHNDEGTSETSGGDGENESEVLKLLGSDVVDFLHLI